MTNPLILDTDGGVDDAQALLMLLANGRAPMAITTVFGNVDLDAATRNVLAVLAVGDRGDIPVHAGADRPIVGDLVEARHIHGEDGLGGAVRPDLVPPEASRDAVGFLVATLRGAAGRRERIDILAIGPLTNIALALRTAPDITTGIGRLTIMGGTLYGRGNVTPAAEFNIFADPEAAAIVFRAPVSTLVVPWETCASSSISGEMVEVLFADAPGGAATTLSHELAAHARRIAGGFGHGDRLRFVDTLAAAVALDASVATSLLEASVDIATAPGLTRGMMLVDPSGRLGTPRAQILAAADLVRLVDLYRRSVTGALQLG